MGEACGEQQSYGHGIGVGDINGDGRNDILTPKGWLEAPPDVRAAGEWKFHPTDWERHPIAPGGRHAARGQPRKFGFMYVLDLNRDGRPDILTTTAHDYGICGSSRPPTDAGCSTRSTAPGRRRMPPCWWI